MPTIKLILDTRDAVKQQKTNSVLWNISDMLRDVRKGVNWIMYHSVEMPNMFHNIISTNNYFVWEVYTPDGLTLLRTSGGNLAQGHYNKTEFETAFEALLDANDADTYTVTYSDITNKFTITNDAGNRIKFIFATSTMGRVVGFTEDSASAVAITGDRPNDLRGVTSVLIQSNLANARGIRATGDGGSVNTFLAEVKMDQAYGSTVFYNNTNMLDLITISKIPDNINMQLRNRNNVLLDIQNFDWKIAVLVSYND